MNILDELRQKAEEKKRALHEHKTQEAQHEKTYQKILLPKMQFLFDSFQELIEYLNFLEEPVLVPHYSPKYPHFGTLFQRNYKINTDGRMGMADYNRLMQINVRFLCEAEGSFSYTLNGKSLIDKEHAFLFDRGLRFQQKNRGMDGALFIVERKIPVHFRIMVDYKKAVLKVGIFNHENFQVFQKTFMPEQLDDCFLDTLLGYFMRRDNRFIHPDISAQDRAAILDYIAPFHNGGDRDGDMLAEPTPKIADPIKNLFSKFQR
ncbi:hypothetical protein [Methylovulum psychrotolerans]|uniref:Uncharacterized protein n=1 Tax=Methylovulum psychrotolerans TaxID=1704499 RepID=A0A2S5CSD3_9GAMM|nr:hypothetical protein [Methylovulum psychrotolerans]POZ53731.1 hypothetical protein AADEFJLK_00772 [Methylovulum psychrotolerans]